MKNNVCKVLLCVLLSALLLSCSREAPVLLKPVSFSEWDEQLASYEGNIVVADLWAMWCAPCIKRFPKMVDLHHKYAGQKVTFVSINLDDPQNTESLQKAENFLKEVKAEFDNFYFNENLIDAFEHMEVIALPVVIIYNTKGGEAVRLTTTDPNNQFTGDDIEKAVNELLATI